ncbi:MAG: LysR family transcriptional regulator [Paracoccaceae bacterium]
MKKPPDLQDASEFLQIVGELLQVYPAKMQKLDWNLLRFLLAVDRAGSFLGAARQLGVDDTTVSRRLRTLQEQVGAQLVQRDGGGGLVLTAPGRLVADHAERVATEMSRLAEAMGAASQPAMGVVRLTAVPLIANRLILPHMGKLFSGYPGLGLELVAEARNSNLTRRDADLALRFARPESGGVGLWTRRIATLPYSLFAAPGLSADAPLISYAEDMAHLPQARWIEARLRAGRSRRAALRVTDAETARGAAVAGLGIAVLPTAMAHGPSLVALPSDERPPERELWLLGHRDQRDQRHIRAVISWLERIFATGRRPD